MKYSYLVFNDEEPVIVNCGEIESVDGAIAGSQHQSMEWTFNMKSGKTITVFAHPEYTYTIAAIDKAMTRALYESGFIYVSPTKI